MFINALWGANFYIPSLQIKFLAMEFFLNAATLDRWSRLQSKNFAIKVVLLFCSIMSIQLNLLLKFCYKNSSTLSKTSVFSLAQPQLQLKLQPISLLHNPQSPYLFLCLLKRVASARIVSRADSVASIFAKPLSKSVYRHCHSRS